MTAVLLAAVAFAIGYTARCVRPLERIDIWAWDQVYRRACDLSDGPARRRPGWYAAQAVFAVEIAGLFVVRPRRMARKWRHRNDPPPRRSPAVRIIGDPAPEEYAARTPTDQEGTTR